MSSEEIEEFIKNLDDLSKDMCVYPDKMTYDCCDCYLCRKDFFEHVRADLRDKQQNLLSDLLTKQIVHELFEVVSFYRTCFLHA